MHKGASSGAHADMQALTRAAVAPPPFPLLMRAQSAYLGVRYCGIEALPDLG